MLNRTGFFQLAEQAVRSPVRGSAASSTGAAEGSPGLLILADLDHFKQLNDEHGHLAGDRAIVAFADCCRSAVRSTDLVARYGGEEFILLLFGADAKRAGQVTSAISTELLRRSQLGDPVLPTVSFGVAELDPSLDLEQIVERADLALYRAKAAGRNRTVHYSPETTR